MDYISITLQHDTGWEDLKIPAFVAAGELMRIFGELYGIEVKTIQAEPRGIILDKNKTLEEQGVLYGAKLTVT